MQRPKVHVGSSVANGMDDWKDLEILTQNDALVEVEAAQDGLTSEPTQLHAQFEMSSEHLDEVRHRHTEVLVTAGMLPESNLAQTQPERALAWMVNSLNGRLNPHGLSIPLLGTSLEKIMLKSKTTEDATLVQLNVSEGEFEPLVKEFPLPQEASASLTATFLDGRLHISW